MFIFSEIFIFSRNFYIKGFTFFQASGTNIKHNGKPGTRAVA